MDPVEIVAGPEGLAFILEASAPWIGFAGAESGQVVASGRLLVDPLIVEASAPTAPGTYEAAIVVRDVEADRPVARVDVTLRVLPDNRWANVIPSADSRKIYVSSSVGNDSSSGASEQVPLRSIAAALALIRPGMPDHVYLKRGDVWTDEPIHLSSGGRSLEEPLVFAPYGESGPRPRLIGGNFYAKLDSPYVWIIGLHIEQGGQREFATGVRHFGRGEGFLLEDCFLRGWKDNVIVYGTDGPLSKITIRRNIIIDSVSDGGHSQGLYMDNSQDVLIEENLFDHNGWREGEDPQSATIFNHNVYIQANCQDVRFERNISSRASSHGVQLRPGGIATNNLLVANPINLLFGSGDLDFAVNPATGSVRGNVVIDSRDIDSSNPRGSGIWVENANSVDVRGNIVAHLKQGTLPKAIHVAASYQGVRLHDNVVSGWFPEVDGIGIGPAFSFQNIATGSGNEVMRNRVRQPVGGAMIEMEGGFIPSNWEFTDNEYGSAYSSTRWFRVQGSDNDFSFWAGLATESGSTTVSSAVSVSQRSLAPYWTSAGRNGGRNGFLEAARSRALRTWPFETRASTANRWIREGFGVSEEAATD